MFARVSTSEDEIVPPVAGQVYDDLYVHFSPELEGDYSTASFRVGPNGTYIDDFHSLVGIESGIDFTNNLFLCGAYRAIDVYPKAGRFVQFEQAGGIVWQSDWPTQFTTGSESKEIPVLNQDFRFWLATDEGFLIDPQTNMNETTVDVCLRRSDAFGDNRSLRTKRTVPITIENNGENITLDVPVLSFSSSAEVVAFAGGFSADVTLQNEPFVVQGLSFVNFKFKDIKQIFFCEGDLEEYNALDFKNVAETAFFALDDRIEIGGIAIASPIFRGYPVSGLIVGANVYTEPAEGGVNAVQVGESLTVGDTVFIPTSLVGAYESAVYQSLTDRGYFVVQRGLITPPPSPISPVRSLI